MLDRIVQEKGPTQLTLPCSFPRKFLITVKGTYYFENYRKYYYINSFHYLCLKIRCIVDLPKGITHVGRGYYHVNKASFYNHSFIIRFVIIVLSSKMDME
jgi:hypothetical protein